MTVRLQEGRFYRTRAGRTVGPMVADGRGFRAHNGFIDFTWHPDGCAARGTVNPGDLVSECSPPHVVPDNVHYRQARDDAGLYGVGFLVDGRRVSPDRVTVIRAPLDGVAVVERAMRLTDDQVTAARGQLAEFRRSGVVGWVGFLALEEYLPGSLRLAARALGLPPREVRAKMLNGQVQADTFLPLFDAELRREFTP